MRIHATPTTGALRSVLLTACVLAVSIGASGCGDDPSDLPLGTIYLSVPQHGQLASRGDDIEDAVKLALDQTNYDTPDVRIELKILDSADDVANVSRVRRDDTALAYIFDGATYETGRIGTPIEGDGGGASLLGISLAPASHALDSKIVPGLTTIHLLPSAADNGAALAQAIAERAPEQVMVYVGDSPFARRAAAGFRGAISKTPIELRQTRGGTGINAITGADGATVFGADRPQAPDPTSRGTLVTPALPPAGYPPNGEKFFEWFDEAYGRQPDRWAIWGYEAVGLALNAITDAGEGKGATGATATATDDHDVNRDSTREAAFAITNRFGPVGHYDVLPDGQTTLYTFAIRPWPLKPAAEDKEPRVIEVGR